MGVEEPMRTNQPTTAASPRPAHNPQPQPALLYTRAQAAHLLSCSVATLIRAEARSDLPAVRLNPKGNGKVYYSAADVHALAKGGAENRTTRGSELGLEGSPEGTSNTPSSTSSNEGEKRSRTKPSSKLLERLATALATKSEQGGYPLFRDLTSRLVREALADEGYDLSDRQFRMVLWNNPDLAGSREGGRRTRGDRDKFEADGQELRAIVLQQLVPRANENRARLTSPSQGINRED